MEGALILSRMNRVNILLTRLIQKAINQTNTHKTFLILKPGNDNTGYQGSLHTFLI